MSAFGSLIHLFWISGIEQPYFHLTEAYIIYMIIRCSEFDLHTGNFPPLDDACEQLGWR